MIIPVRVGSYDVEEYFMYNNDNNKKHKDNQKIITDEDDENDHDYSDENDLSSST